MSQKKINVLARYVLTLLMLALFSSSAFSQTKINGKVTGADSKPIQGATVAVAGSNQGTITN